MSGYENDANAYGFELSEALDNDDGPAALVRVVRSRLADSLAYYTDDSRSLAESAGVTPTMMSTLLSGKPSKGLDDFLRLCWGVGLLPHEILGPGLERGPPGLPIPVSAGPVFEFVVDYLRAKTHDDPRVTGAEAALALVNDYEAGDRLEALAAVEAAIGLDPMCAPAWLRLSNLMEDDDELSLAYCRKALFAAGSRLTEAELADWTTSTPAQCLYLEAKTEMVSHLLLADPGAALLHAREVAAIAPSGPGGLYWAMCALRAGVYDEWHNASERVLSDPADPVQVFLRLLGRFVIEGPSAASEDLRAAVQQWPDAARSVFGTGVSPRAIGQRELSRHEIQSVVVGMWLWELWQETPGASKWLRAVANDAGVSLADFYG